MSNYRKQHYVPQVYLKAWNNENGKILCFDKEKKKVKDDYTTNGIMYKSNLYTLSVFDDLILTDEEKNEIFKCLDEYVVVYKDEDEGDILLDTPKLKGNYYYNFENWKITRADGTLVSKKKLKSEIDKIRRVDIEKDFHQVEDNWLEIRGELESSKNDSVNLSEQQLEILLRFIVFQKFRTPSFKNECEEVIADGIRICGKHLGMDAEKNLGQVFDTHKKRLGGAIFKKFLSDGQNSKAGLIAREIEKLKTMKRMLYRRNNPCYFTSDNPVIELKDIDCRDIICLPITPKIIIVFYDNRASIESSLNTILNINKLVVENAERFYIIP